MLMRRGRDTIVRAYGAGVAAAAIVGAAALAATLYGRAAVVTGCDGTNVTEALSARVTEGPSGAAFPLAEVTAFEWDRVHVFSGYASLAEMRATLGAEYTPADLRAHPEAGRFVFLEGGVVVCEIAVGPPPWLQGPHGSALGPDARVVVQTVDPGPYTAFRVEG